MRAELVVEWDFNAGRTFTVMCLPAQQIGDKVKVRSDMSLAGLNLQLERWFSQ